MESSNILETIKSRGYWRVLIRPSKYIKNRIPSLNKCEQIIKHTKVSLRGWDFPHVERDLIYEKDFIESVADFLHILEYWRFYKSGQFIHYFGFEEDWYRERMGTIASSGMNKSPMGFLDVISTLFRISEIYEFTARLIEAKLIDSYVELSIRLINTKKRELFFCDYSRPAFVYHICKDSEIEYSEKKSVNKILGNTSNLAIDAASFIFSFFDWGGEEMKRILVNYQTQLLNRKI
jgi:hypothetical protein